MHEEGEGDQRLLGEGRLRKRETRQGGRAGHGGLDTNFLHHFPLWKVDFKFYFPTQNLSLHNGGLEVAYHIVSYSDFRGSFLDPPIWGEREMV